MEETRKIDNLGRVVLTQYLRDKAGLKRGDEVEFRLEGEEIIIKKAREKCVLCGQHEQIKEVKGRYICQSCIDDIRKA